MTIGPNALALVALALGVLSAGCCYLWRSSLLDLLYTGRSTIPDYAQLTGVPHPKPLLDFNIDTAKARPYRPFRWEYHQTMALSKLEPDWWIELESTYRARLEQRKQLYKTHGTDILYCTPGHEAACRELMEMVVQFLTHRYPLHFAFSPRTGILENRILGRSWDVRAVDPLVVLLENVPEDFLIVLENEKTGAYHLRAGVCCSAMGWNLGLKMGMSMREIHEPVPDYKEKMAMSMDRYFSKMPTDKPIQRGSWGIEVGEPVYLQEYEEEYKHRHDQDPNLDIKNVNLRVDHQTLRRLPRSRGVVFNFKALFSPLEAFREEPFVPELVLKVLMEGKQNILDYKGTVGVEHKVIPVLKQWAEEQKEKGWVPRDWEVRTLDEHPFFPGWQTRTKM